MFAVLKTGGKQYKVAKNDTFAVEKLSAEPGETVQFDEILMLGGDEKVTIGNPFVTGAAVQAEVVDQFRGPKTISFKKRRRKHSSQRRKGHRQSLTMIRVTDILTSGAQESGGQAAGGGKSAAKAPKAAAERKEPAASAGAAAGTPPANLLSEAKGTPDDLKRLSGVGPKMEKALNDAGVYHFSQIADWTEAEVAYMDEALSARGRIERDNWTSQAAEFAAAEE